MTEFTPIASLVGGMMIGLSAVLLMAWEGRIAGVAGIAGLLLPPYRDDFFRSRFAFILGLIAAPLLWIFVTGQPVVQTVSSNLPVMFAAGVIVGFGTAYGHGCTSGHGVCGLSRLSMRSLVATSIFIATAMITVFVVRHAIGG